MVYFSENNSFHGNDLFDNDYGIYEVNAINNVYSNNHIVNNTEAGVSLHNSYGSTFNNNTFELCPYGIHIGQSLCTVFTNNSFDKGGFTIGDSGFFYWNEADPIYWYSHTIDSTNTIKGKPVLFLKNVSAFTFPSNIGQMILFNCSSMNVSGQTFLDSVVGATISYSRNISMANNTFSNNSLFDCYINDSENCTISNNEFIHIPYYGIVSGKSFHLTIRNNTFEGPNGTAIDFDETDFHLIEGNIIKDTEYGIAYGSSSNSLVRNNTILGNDVGICVTSWSDNISVSFNHFSMNNYGVYAYSVRENVTATNNWWGHDSGPHHDTWHPHGKGDDITDNVDFDPWLNAEGEQVYQIDFLKGLEDDEPTRYPLVLLLILLIGLFAALVVVVFTPKKRFLT